MFIIIIQPQNIFPVVSEMLWEHLSRGLEDSRYCRKLVESVSKTRYALIISRSPELFRVFLFVPEPTARSAVRRGLLIPHGYLHPGKSEHSEVQQQGNLLPLCKNSAGNRIKIKFSKYYHIFSKMPGI